MKKAAQSSGFFCAFLQSYAVYPDVIRTVDGIDDFAVVGFVGHKVETVGVEAKDAHIVLLLAEEVEITLLDVSQVRITDFLLVAASTLADVVLQTIHVGIEIYQ